MESSVYFCSAFVQSLSDDVLYSLSASCRMRRLGARVAIDSMQSVESIKLPRIVDYLPKLEYSIESDNTLCSLLSIAPDARYKVRIVLHENE